MFQLTKDGEVKLRVLKNLWMMTEVELITFPSYCVQVLPTCSSTKTDSLVDFSIKRNWKISISNDLHCHGESRSEV